MHVTSTVMEIRTGAVTEQKRHLRLSRCGEGQENTLLEVRPVLERMSIRCLMRAGKIFQQRGQ